MEMHNLVVVINKLQEVFATVGSECLLLPQIIVVGAQSSGKSSVLESLVGRSFLPRGTGVITRRPLILQLLRCPGDDSRRSFLAEGDKAADWGVFLHEKDKVFIDFDDIRKEIEKETVRKAGCNKGICAEPIVLKIFSERVLDLTMVDLPGITKVPVGDQPPDVEIMVRDLVLQYISNPNSLILAIVTANTDMATSESLKMAKEVDPHGSRTLAVVTKLDLMDAGTDAGDILTGNVIPVKLGIVGVVNRSQKDIQSGKTIKEALIDEAKYLRTKYPTIAARHGSTYLVRSLQALLLSHIRNCLPDLKSRVNSAIGHYQSLLSTYGESYEPTNEVLLQVLTRFVTAFCSTIQGTNKNLETTELGGGARISYIFHETFGKTLDSIDPLLGFNSVAIMTAIRNASGAKPALFIPEICFELLVKKLIKKLESPSLRCVELVYEEMERIVHNCGPEITMEMMRFPALHQRIVDVVNKLLNSRVPATNEMVEKLIKIHSAYINTGHPDFVRDTLSVCPGNELSRSRHALSEKAVMSVVGHKQQAPLQAFPEAPPRDCLVIERLITSYFGIVKKTVQDCVPKAIMHFLVNFVMEHLLSELVAQLYAPGNATDLLTESFDIKDKRQEAAYVLNALEKANAIICEIKETKVW